MPTDEQWCFRPHHLCSSPSKTIDSLPLAQELKLRAEGVHFLLRIGAHLMLKVSVLATAATYFHRFYMRHSIKQFDRIYLAAACLFLACKVEESTRKLKDVAAYCWRKTNEPAIKENEALDFWQERILSNEEILLEALCFDLIVDHPHQHLAEAVGGGSRKQQTTFTWTGPLSDIPKATCELAWSITNDSLRTPLVLFHQPRIIACGCYLLAFLLNAALEGTSPHIAENITADESNPSKGSSFGADVTSHMNKTGGLLDTERDGVVADRPLFPTVENENLTPRTPTIDDILQGLTDAGRWKEAFRVSNDEVDAISGNQSLVASKGKNLTLL
ncbi:hypothetical protein FRC03_006735 [Tulasnella sp. 419]|nr:hypothetical protein FRC03_006735 [Tulasnella sp. 419]